MKINITESVLKTIELPLYFKSKAFPDHYFMTVGDKSAVEVTDYEISESIVLYPSVKVISIEHNAHMFRSGIEPISETEFKTVFLRVSLSIEKLMN